MDQLTPEEKLKMYEDGYTLSDRVAMSDGAKRAMIEFIIARKLSVYIDHIHDPIAVARKIIEADKTPAPAGPAREPRWMRSEQFFHNSKRTARMSRRAR